MADTKNYGLVGVGDDVQFGKGGGRLVYNTGSSDFRATSDGSTLVHLQVLDPVGDTDAATKLYVDNAAAGLDPKESCQAATTGNIGTYNASGGSAGTGQLTSVAATIDGVTLAEGDRVLVKNQTVATQNGIYVVTATTTTLDRAPDQDGTPASEVSAGNFTFVEAGTINANSGWVLQGDGVLTLNTDNLDWVLFSTSGDVVAGDGLVKTGNTLNVDFVNGGGYTNSVAIASTDQIAFADASNGDAMQLRTMANVISDLNIHSGDGTVTDSVLRWNGTNYIEETQVQVSSAGVITVYEATLTDGLTISYSGTTATIQNTDTDVPGFINIFDSDNSGLMAGTGAGIVGTSANDNAPSGGGNQDSALFFLNNSQAYAGSIGFAADATSPTPAFYATNLVYNGNMVLQTTDSGGQTNDRLLVSGSGTNGLIYRTVGNAARFSVSDASTGSVNITGGTSGNDARFQIVDSITSPTILASFGFEAGTDLVISNNNDAGLVSIEGDATGGATRSLIVMDPDADITMYHAGSSVVQTHTAATGGLFINNTLTGGGFERVLTTSDGAGGSLTTGDSSIVITDTGTDGTATFTMDSTAVLTITDTVATFQNGLDITLNTGSTLTVTDLSSDRVVFTTTGGELTSSANLTFDGSSLAVTGDASVDNINLNGNTISITDTNGNLIIQPNGTGQITLANGSGEEILELQDTVSAVNGLLITAGATGNAPTISSNATGSEANVDIGFVLAGTGVLSVTAGSGNYEDNVTADDDVPNKKYVDDAITNGAVSGSLSSVTGTVDLTSASTQNIGAADGIPDGATIISVMLDVTVASDAATTVTVGDATNGAASYMAATENDPETTGIYIADVRVANSGAARQAQATVATAGSTGSATVIITYRNA